VAALLAAGCAEMSEDYRQQMYLGETYYKNLKFYESIGNFTRAVEAAQNDDEKYKALLGVANAATEHGLNIYQHAESLIRNRNRAAGAAKCAEADQWHDTANRTYAKLLDMRPKDTIANYYLGLFLYKRATSFSELPYPGTEGGKAQRRKERDGAVHHFGIVLSHERGDITSPKHVTECRSPEMHRYLALALFARSDWSKNDGEHARRNLMVYLNLLKNTQSAVTDSPLATEDPEGAKLEKERRMERLRKEISDTRALLHEQFKGCQQLVELWQSRKEQPPISENDREAWINAAKREISALTDLSREFQEAAQAARKPAVEKPVDGQPTGNQ
jgi:tetratricopeptide (TPR) repeat protein